MVTRWAASVRGDRGTSAVEYGLLVAAIAVVVAAIVFSVGVKVRQAFDDTCRAVATAQGGQQQGTPLRRALSTTC